MLYPCRLPGREAQKAFSFADLNDWLVKQQLCYNSEETIALLLSLELNGYVKGLSVPSVYALKPENCNHEVFEFIYE